MLDEVYFTCMRFQRLEMSYALFVHRVETIDHLPTRWRKVKLGLRGQTAASVHEEIDRYWFFARQNLSRVYRIMTSTDLPSFIRTMQMGRVSASFFRDIYWFHSSSEVSYTFYLIQAQVELHATRVRAINQRTQICARMCPNLQIIMLRDNILGKLSERSENIWPYGIFHSNRKLRTIL